MSRCSSKYKPDTHGLRPRGHLSYQNVSFSSAKTRALSRVYTDTYDDGAVLHCFLFLFLCDCTNCIS